MSKSHIVSMQEAVVEMDRILKSIQNEIQRIADYGPSETHDNKIMMSCTRYVHCKHRLDQLIEEINK